MMVEFENTKVYGMAEAIKAMRLSYGSKGDSTLCENAYNVVIGKEDDRLIRKLIVSGESHRKFMRQILVAVDIRAPRYWWMQFDTYKVGVTSCSESTMHTIMKKPITPSDFSFDCYEVIEERFVQMLEDVRKTRNFERLISLLPQSYIQKRHVTFNYEAIHNIVWQRKGHKLSEWRDFCEWADTLPHAALFFKPLQFGPQEPDGGIPFEVELCSNFPRGDK